MWWVVFALLVNWLNGGCGYIFDWTDVGFRGANSCPAWKADVAFAFLSALCWLVSAIVGVYWTHRHRRTVATTHTTGAPVRRHRWYRSHRYRSRV
jgi:hypothetical protein